MQRTVKTTIVEYVALVDGKMTEGTFTTTETDEKRVMKALRKKYPNSMITATRTELNRWILDDEIFFKYAHIDNSNTEDEKVTE